MGKKLYVGNLTYSVTSYAICKSGSHRSAPCRAPRSSRTVTMGRSKGFGFVEMDTDAQAEAAIQGLNDHEHDGRRLTVAEAKPREARTVGVAGGVVVGIDRHRLDLTTIHGSEPQVNSYPASEQRIREVERGRICNAILPMPRSQTLSAGDSIVFALADSHPGQKSGYVECGDSVCVLLTEITDLGATDPATGQALFRFSWKPLGQSDSPGTSAKRVVKSRSSHRTG